MSKQNRRGVVLGGYGHALCLFNEAQAFGLPLDLAGIAPAYDGEALDFFTGHPWFQEQNPPVFENVSAALESVDADLAIVSTRHDQICSAIRAALEAGLDVITEKPLALNDADLQSLFEMVQETGRRVLPMFSMRAMPAFRMARSLNRWAIQVPTAKKPHLGSCSPTRCCRHAKPPMSDEFFPSVLNSGVFKCLICGK